MNVIIVYASLLCCTILSMEQIAQIKELLSDQPSLITYLESIDARSKTPLMNLLEKASDEQLEEILPLLINIPFNTEIVGPAQETAFFFACDRPSIVAASLMIGLGCALDPTSPAGRPLYFAFINDNVALAELLVQEGADPQVPGDIVALASHRPDFAELKKIIEKAKIP